MLKVTTLFEIQRYVSHPNDEIEYWEAVTHPVISRKYAEQLYKSFCRSPDLKFRLVKIETVKTVVKSQEMDLSGYDDNDNEEVQFKFDNRFDCRRVQFHFRDNNIPYRTFGSIGMIVKSSQRDRVLKIIEENKILLSEDI